MPKGVYPHLHIVPKKYDPELVERVKALYYGEGMSQVEVAETLGTTQKVIWKLMINHQLKTRPQIKRNQLGPRNGSWRGDVAGYQAMHIRVITAKGRPSFCAVCGTNQDTVHYEWANLTGDYSDIDDYARMCVGCHRRFDAKRRQETGARTSPTRRVMAKCP